MTNCADPNCNHPEENHKNMDGTNKCICNGSIFCSCEKFEEQYLMQFAQDIEIQKAKCRTINKRCIYILEKIPQMRNAGEKSFARVYKEIWHGVKIRKNVNDSTTVNTQRDFDIPHDDSINREKRRVKENPNLATYDPKVIEKQNAIFQAYMELSIEV